MLNGMVLVAFCSILVAREYRNKNVDIAEMYKYFVSFLLYQRLNLCDIFIDTGQYLFIPFS